MATELAVGYVTLLPSAKGFAANVGKELDSVQGVADDVGQKAGGRFSESFKSKLKIGAAIGGAMAAAATTKFLGDAVGAASDLAESTSKVQQVFGEQAGTIRTFADTAATALGQSQQQALEAAGTFGNLFTSMGLSQDAAAGMSTEVVTLASDLASFNNLAPEEALEKLRAGLVGEVEPLRALGVNFNAAEVEAKAMALGLADADGEVSESAKVQARMALILAKTTNAQGDFARTSDGLANQQRIANAQWEDAKAKIGTALLPVMTRLTSFVAGKLIPAFISVASAVGKVGRFIADNIEYFIALGVGIMSALVPALIAQATAGFTAAAAGVAVAAAWIAANAPLIAIAAGVAALAAGVIWAYQNVDIFRRVVDTVAKFLTGTVWGVIRTGARLFTDTLVPAIGAVIDWFGNLLTKAGEIASGIGSKVGEIVRFFSGLAGTLASVAGDVFGFLRDSFKAAVNFVIRGWNRLEFKIPGFDPPGPGPKFGGFTLGLPKIEEFHTGGLYQAPGGASEGLALLQSGERVLSRAQTRMYDQAGIGMGGPQLHFHQSGHDPGQVLGAVAWAMSGRA